MGDRVQIGAIADISHDFPPSWVTVGEIRFLGKRSDVVWLVFNKIDLIALSDLDVICEKIINAIGWQGKVLRVSAVSGEGCDIIAKNVMEELEKMAFEEVSN